PWPEEMNRTLIGRLASLHFSPTVRSRQTLLREGVNEGSVIVTGNTVIDALQQVAERLKTDKTLSKTVAKQFSFINPQKKLVLVTGHRRENLGTGFERICHALKIISSREDAQIVYPLHLNPAVREPVQRILGAE